MPAVTNTLSTLMTDPVRNFRFLVTFKPTDEWKDTGFKPAQMGFVSLSGLSVTTEPIAYREGGYNTNVHQIPGQSAFTPITLSKGVMLGQDSNMKWMKRLFSVITPSITFILLLKLGSGAYPSNHTYSIFIIFFTLFYLYNTH